MVSTWVGEGSLGKLGLWPDPPCGLLHGKKEGMEGGLEALRLTAH